MKALLFLSLLLPSRAGAVVIEIGQVGTNQIQSGAVNTAAINTDAVTNSAVINGAVTTGKLASGAVDTTKLLNDSVANAAILNAAITTGKLASGAVDTTKLLTDAVTSAFILNSAVTTAKLGTDAVGHAALLNDSSSLPKVSGQALFNSGGNIGVGKSNPGVLLDVAGAATVGGVATVNNSATAGADVLVNNTGTRGGRIDFALNSAVSGGIGASGKFYGDGSQDTTLQAAAGNGMRFLVNGSSPAKLWITSGGNVGVGTESPTTVLDVHGATVIRSANLTVAGDSITVTNTSGVETGGIDTSGILTATNIVASVVQTAGIGTDAVLTASVINSAITTGKIATDAVANASILNNSVDTNKIKNDSVRMQTLAMPYWHAVTAVGAVNCRAACGSGNAAVAGSCDAGSLAVDREFPSQDQNDSTSALGTAVVDSGKIAYSWSCAGAATSTPTCYVLCIGK